jgi:exosortase
MNPSSAIVSQETIPSTAASSRRLGRVLSWLPMGLVAGAFAWLVLVVPYAAGYGNYRRTLFDWLCGDWQDATWQHGALAFPLAGFLVWRRRRTLSQLGATPSTTGFILTCFSLALYWVGYRGSFFLLGFASIQLLLAGTVLWLGGWRWLRTVLFAWCIAGFAWPCPFLEDSVAFQLRHLMVTGTAWLLNHVGIDTVQDGTRLISAATHGRALGQWFSLNVDGPCSGLRSLFALMMVGALFGYFRQRSLWRRGALFLLSIPLAMAANMGRILLLIGASILFGQKFAIGDGEEYTSNFHLLAGILVFLVAFAGLSLAATLLNRFCGPEKPLQLSED